MISGNLFGTEGVLETERYLSCFSRHLTYRTVAFMLFLFSVGVVV